MVSNFYCRVNFHIVYSIAIGSPYSNLSSHCSNAYFSSRTHSSSFILWFDTVCLPIFSHVHTCRRSHLPTFVFRWCISHYFAYIIEYISHLLVGCAGESDKLCWTILVTGPVSRLGCLNDMHYATGPMQHTVMDYSFPLLQIKMGQIIYGYFRCILVWL